MSRPSKGTNRAAAGQRSRRHESGLGRGEQELLSGALRETLGKGDALLIVPPFATLLYPSLALHLLQACCREAGFRVQVLYANFLLAALVGEDDYSRVCEAPMGSFAAERIFARAAFAVPRLGRRAKRMFEPPWEIAGEQRGAFEPEAAEAQPLTSAKLRRLEAYAESFADLVARAVAAGDYAIAGCTSIFEQTAASVAILNRVKRRNPKTVTVLGGANCEGEMAHGLAALDTGIDYFFSGESERTFPALLAAVVAGKRPAGRVVKGQLCRDLDRLPPPDYEEFFRQRERFLPASATPLAETEMLYETSRGCWWGEKHHCTFCGLNGEGMAFRQKSPERVIEDLRLLSSAHPTRKISMTDNIMPHGYFKSLLARLGKELPGLSIFYEQKANLSLTQMIELRDGGVRSIQPGIEALSTPLLTWMRKGVHGRQNVALLRYARATGIEVSWNLLWGFPGDTIEAYEETLRLVPLLHHLPPPTALWHISLDRFSPYFADPEGFGVKNLRPLPGYFDFLPKAADVFRIAYHFVGEYRSGAHDHLDVLAKLWRAVSRWQRSWKDGNRPAEELRIFEENGSFVLRDTRRICPGRRRRILRRDEAALLLVPRPYVPGREADRAITERLAVVLDGWFVPLAVAEADLLAEFVAPAAQEPATAPTLSSGAVLNVLA